MYIKAFQCTKLYAGCCGRQNNGPPNMFINVTLIWQKEFSDVIKDLERGNYPGLSSGPSVITTVLIRGPREESIREDSRIKEAETKVMHLQDRERDHKPRNKGGY